MPLRVAIVAGCFAVVVAAAFLLTRPAESVDDESAREAAASAVPAGTPAPEPAGEPAASWPAPGPAKPRPATRKPTPAPAPVEPAPTTGTLRVETDVAGATVFLDRIGVGEAPLTIPNIEPGPHRLNVSAPGFDGYAETIEVAPGERTITIAFREIRLDARLDVVHKHGMGSCRGTLTGTPEGLRFIAANGDDSFSVTFADIETFEVHYLEKNLRLKVRRGRTYNFGDPEGNADRLFVFHRDVDKVRARVASGG